MTQLRYPPSTQVAVFPFTRQAEGEDVVIGRPDTGTYLSLPSDAVEILDELGSGKTVGDAQDVYQERYGERPDLEDLLNALEAKGLVGLPDSPATQVWSQPSFTETPPARKYHFTSIPRSLASRLFSPASLGLAGTIVALAALAAMLEPSILPPRDALFFEDSMSSKMLILTIFSFGVIFSHELGHLIAVRAAGVDSRLGIGHRLWMLVIETDMTALWSVARKKRFLPVLAGPIVDATSASSLLLLLFADHAGWLSLSPFAEELLRGATLIYALSLTWQCFFFVRTDFYYVFSIFFGCRNLLQDTEVFLRNGVARLLPFLHHRDQPGIPAREFRVIKAYSVVWILGRILALTVLFWVVLPMLSKYVQAIGSAFRAGYAANPYRFLDAAMITALGLIPLLIGLGMWSASLIQRWR